MELKLANHSSYPRIGDSPEEQLLRRTIAQREKGEKSDADLRAAEDRMTELAIAEQSQAGLDVVTDGLIRWYDPVSHLAGKLAGIHINGLLRFFDTNFYFRQPIVDGKLERTGPLVVDEYIFAKSKTSKTVKAVLTGPYTLARLSLAKDGGTAQLNTLVDGYTKALAAEVGALADAGAALIQVDEPAILKHPEDFSFLKSGTEVLAGWKKSSQLMLAFYFGDAAPLYSKLQSLPVDVLCLDFTYGPNLAAVIAKEGSSKALALGLIDGRNTRLEKADEIARQIEKILKSVKSDGAYLTSSCGLEYLPRDRAQLKLKHLKTVKDTFGGLGKSA
jgi:5-methyltetrahydropteroyltriglutamate--homocysteine methyltransferase